MAKDKFLLYMLAGIFSFQASLFGVGLFFCAKNGGLKACPDVRETYSQTFTVMISTTLALLTGSAISSKGE